MNKLVFFLLLLLSTVVIAQEKPRILAVNQQLKTPSSETEDAILYLQKVDKRDLPYIRFFSLYSIPKESRDNAALTLSFVLHSLTGISSTEENSGGYYPVAIMEDKKVRIINKVSDTLIWVDIRNYNWTPESWELMSLEDGYFVEPIVNHRTNGLLRLLSGNAIVRADWFILHATDITKQTDSQRKTKIYYTLLYAKNKIPKTKEEFEQIWGLNVKQNRQLGAEFATIVTKSSVVARHNRILYGYRTPLGWSYSTYDVLSQTGKRDFVDVFPELRGLPPTTFDAGEIFSSNAHFLQVYALYDGKGNIIDAADAGVARHITDILGDVRVRVPFSCLDCHSAGPLPSENTIKEYIKKNSILKVPYKEDQLRIEKNYLSDKFEESIEDNQVLYARGLLKVNGLKPDENAKNYLDLVTWYNKPLDLKQVAFECGLLEEDLVKGLSEDGGIKNPRIHGRVSILLSTNEPIPRDIWESPGRDGRPGGFQQTMVHLYGLTQIVEEKVLFVTAQNARIVSSTETLRVCEVGEKLPYLGEVINSGHTWYKVNVDGKFGWISQKHVEVK